MASVEEKPPPLEDQRFPLAPTPADPGEGSANVWIRWMYDGGRLARDGRLVRLELSEKELSALPGRRVLQALADAGVDLEHFTPAVYDEVLAGWQPLETEASFDLSQDAVRRVDVKLLMPPGPAASFAGPQEDGYFQIGIIGTKTEANLGTLWRSAFQLGAAGIFQIGCRFAQARHSCDVTNAHAKIPLVEYPEWNDFARSAPFSATWVTQSSTLHILSEPLETFEHPKRAVYILGSEDHGIPGNVLKVCHKSVSLPSVRYPSFNVAVSGSIVMYDRIAKQARAEGEARAGKGAVERRAAPNTQGPCGSARDTPGGRMGARTHGAGG
ncbi:Alpha/beta knot methyltransferase, partial [Baffinella frigidus]